MVNIIGADRFNEHEEYESGYFTFKLIEAATQNFSPANRIYGKEGLFYKGVLPDGMNITVKQIDEIVHDFTYKFNTYEFENEIKFPATFRHQNLVRLLGHCTENNRRFLVYEYMESGSLSNALFGAKENLRKRLDWGTKVRICFGIANGLAFLHHRDESKAMIVHRNIQPRSIFLDKFLDPKISNFGLAKHFGAGETHCNMAVMGRGATGYTAPEYLTTGSVTDKIDVFSFGVSILVLSTEKEAYNRNRFGKNDPASLLDLAKGLHQKGDLLSLIDEDLTSSNSVKKATMLLDLAILCTNYDPKLRPTMSEIVGIMAILCSNSNCTTRIESTANIADISSHNLSSTTMQYDNAVSSNDVFGYNDGVATGSSLIGVPEADEINKDTEFHRDSISNVNVSVGEVGTSVVPLSQVTVASAELLGLNVEPQTSSNSKDARNQKGVQSKLEFSEPFFEEGKLHIEFSDEELRAVCDEWENSLVGFFVDEDVPSCMDLKMVEKLWEVKGDFSVFNIENGYFIFQFSCAEEKIRVLESADLWKIRQRQLILIEWNWKLKLERIVMESLPIWVKIYNLPLFFWTPPVLSKVGSGLGTPLYADQKTQNKQQLAYAMLCIEIDAKKPLPESLHILLKGIEYHLYLEYDWRPLRCEDCCTFGHIALNCKLKMKAKKQN